VCVGFWCLCLGRLPHGNFLIRGYNVVCFVLLGWWLKFGVSTGFMLLFENLLCSGVVNHNGVGCFLIFVLCVLCVLVCGVGFGCALFQTGFCCFCVGCASVFIFIDFAVFVLQCCCNVDACIALFLLFAFVPPFHVLGGCVNIWWRLDDDWLSDFWGVGCEVPHCFLRLL